MEGSRSDKGGFAVGATIGDIYRIVRQIGEGGMGIVYEVSHARLAGRYALKVLRREVLALNPSTQQRLAREAEIMSALRHPNLVQIIDFNTTADGTPFIVMEYLEGSDLERRMAQRGPMPLPEAVNIVEQVGAALTAAHERSIVHRDLKPANVFLVPLAAAPAGLPTEFVKVLDFGISKVKTSPTLATNPVIMGTPHYMAPEQVRANFEDIDGRADQFALAAMTYELLTGRKAFPGDTIEAALYSVVHEIPPSLAPVAGELVDAAVMTGLSKNRSDRYPSVNAFVSALRAALRASQARGGGHGPPSRTPQLVDTSLTPGGPIVGQAASFIAPTVAISSRRVALFAAIGVAAVIVAALVARRSRGLTETTTGATPAAMLKAAAALRLEVERAVATERQALEGRVRTAAAVPELRNAARSHIDTLTFTDLFASEDWWQPFRDLTAVVLDGLRPMVTRGAPDVVNPSAWSFRQEAPGVAAGAQPGVASTIVWGEQRPYLAAGSDIDGKGTFSLVLAEPLDARRLEALAKSAGVLRLIPSDGTHLFGGAAQTALAGRESEPVVVLPANQIAFAVPISNRGWLWAVADSSEGRP
ncbi:MAG: eukaryotic-like serine/threonine-protein kinase [Myxococcales bacterium]|jgi:tRNA A-37 threonylcarbamoyl transferase component Bud32|nr:eukaryotic-like serine/threonine-protein kinase [Myxococcales bacterium]